MPQPTQGPIHRESTAAIASQSARKPSEASPRERFELTEGNEPVIAVQVQRPCAASSRADVVYVHGATFGADLSVFFPFDGRSWADSLTGAGFSAWGFDFVGYGASARYPSASDRPAGDIDAALRDLRRVVALVRQRNGDRPIVLLAHSRGGALATRHAAGRPDDVSALVLFAPIVMRPAPVNPPAASPSALPSHYPVSVWAQYRRFIEDVPRGEPQVLSEAHMQAWGEAFLASDTDSGTRSPAAVQTPSGPVADIAMLWNGQALYDPRKVTVPTLLIRGAWDSLCNDADAQRLMASLGAARKEDVKIPRGTHLLHLEQQRGELHARVNRFLQEVLA